MTDHPKVPTPGLFAAVPDEGEEETGNTRVTEHMRTFAPLRVRNRPTLTVISGAETGRVYSLAAATVLGRGKHCPIRLDDNSVSREHARIVREEGGAMVLEDLGSRNGTLIDGVRVHRHELSEGDRIQLGPAVHLRFSLVDDEEEGILRRLYESSVRDPLTGVFNRSHFNERLGSEVSYTLRHRTPLALVMFDLDHFKQVNDTYGHLAGDLVLSSVGTLVAATVRTEDIVARYGGEEFAVIARGINALGAVAMAERIRSIIQLAKMHYEHNPISVTVSVGVATFDCCAHQRSVEGLIAAADARLYQAKQRGRNRVVGP